MKMVAETRKDYYYYYEFSDSKQPMIEVLNINSHISREGIIGINEIIFVLQGECNIYCDVYPPVTVSKKESIFLPSGSRFRATSMEGSDIIVFRMDPLQKLQGSYSVEELYNESLQYTFPEEAGKLEINHVMNQYLLSLSNYIRSGLSFPVLYEIKIKELLLILDSFYKKKNLCYFFKPVLNKDFIFASTVFDNWEKARNVKDLADLCSYSESAFNKKFKSVFGTTPYKWLNERKSAKILFEINNSTKPLKQIADEYDFNSQQQFHDYCIRNFNQTPGNLRNSG